MLLRSKSDKTCRCVLCIICSILDFMRLTPLLVERHHGGSGDEPIHPLKMPMNCSVGVTLGWAHSKVWRRGKHMGKVRHVYINNRPPRTAEAQNIICYECQPRRPPSCGDACSWRTSTGSPIPFQLVYGCPNLWKSLLIHTATKRSARLLPEDLQVEWPGKHG